jgi:nucleotidyltransferase substrate binding protein (TIGR01987 family)
MVPGGERTYLDPLLKAAKVFSEGFASASSELERDGVIQRFEFTYELAWKTLKRVLALKGIEANNPRDVFREAARQKLLDDPVVWFDFLEKRNLTVHTYNRVSAEEIYESLPAFEREIKKLVEVLKHHEK